MNNTLINLLLDKEFKPISLTLCLILGNQFGNKKEFFDDIYERVNINRVYEKIKELNSNGILNINDRQLSREFNRSNIKKELIRLEFLELIYYDLDKDVYTSNVLVPKNLVIKSEFWKLYLKGNSSTRNMLKFLLSQIINHYKQEVYISTSLLLEWVKDNTTIKSITGRDYTRSMKTLVDSSFLSLISKNKYIISTEFISPKDKI